MVPFREDSSFLPFCLRLSTLKNKATTVSGQFCSHQHRSSQFPMGGVGWGGKEGKQWGGSNVRKSGSAVTDHDLPHLPSDGLIRP